MQTTTKLNPNAVKFKQAQLPNYRVVTPKKDSSLLDVPQTELYRRAVKMYLVGALIWDYVDTILDQAIQMRISATKPLTREVKTLKAEYSYLLSRDLKQPEIERFSELSLLFEDINAEHLKRFHFSINTELNQYNLAPDYKMLVESVQTAMLLIDAIYIYVADCDKFIAQYYAAPSTILPLQIRQLRTLLPQFAGDSYNAESPVRKLTAKILANEIKNIDIEVEHGKDRTP